MTDLSNREKTLFDLAKQYRESQVRSANENDIRADIRENVEKLGLDSKAFQDSIRMELELTPGERTDYVNGLQDMQSVLNGRASDLFGEEEMRKKAERIKRREEKAAAQVQPRAKADAKSDKNPKSDPKRGGAGKGKGKGKEAPAPADGADTLAAGDAGAGDGGEADDGPIMIKDPVTGEERPETGDEMILRVAREKNAELEQREGADKLNAVGTQPVEKVVPKSQSQLAQERLEAASLGGKLN